MTAHAFAARYPGRCAACDAGIEVDDLLVYDEDRQVVHADCAESVNRHRIKPRPVCPRCFITKAANGSCGCDA
ncbi:hypothetical protein [Nocardioides sp.]|uniref:hypothetical protein n=1 Tax=Nocardioides sp. TaxID=35761 RepID=UPI0039E676E9